MECITYQRADTLGAARADERDRVGETLAAPDTGHGGGIDGPCLELTSNAALSRAAVAAASRDMSTQGGRKRHREVA